MANAEAAVPGSNPPSHTISLGATGLLCKIGTVNLRVEGKESTWGKTKDIDI